MTKIFEPCASLSKADNEYITRLVNLNLLKIHAMGVAGVVKTSARAQPAGVNRHAYEVALARSHKVLEAVELLGRPELLAKVYLYRGHCFYNLQQWKSAHECYVRAASHRPAQELIEIRTRECLNKMGRTSRGRPPAVHCCGKGRECVVDASYASEDGSESDIWLQLADEECNDDNVGDCPALNQADSVKPKLRRTQGSIASLEFSSSLENHRERISRPLTVPLPGVKKLKKKMDGAANIENRNSRIYQDEDVLDELGLVPSSPRHCQEHGTLIQSLQKDIASLERKHLDTQAALRTSQDEYQMFGHQTLEEHDHSLQAEIEYLQEQNTSCENALAKAKSEMEVLTLTLQIKELEEELSSKGNPSSSQKNERGSEDNWDAMQTYLEESPELFELVKKRAADGIGKAKSLSKPEMKKLELFFSFMDKKNTAQEKCMKALGRDDPDKEKLKRAEKLKSLHKEYLERFEHHRLPLSSFGRLHVLRALVLFKTQGVTEEFAEAVYLADELGIGVGPAFSPSKHILDYLHDELTHAGIALQSESRSSRRGGDQSTRP